MYEYCLISNAKNQPLYSIKTGQVWLFIDKKSAYKFFRQYKIKLKKNNKTCDLKYELKKRRKFKAINLIKNL